VQGSDEICASRLAQFTEIHIGYPILRSDPNLAYSVMNWEATTQIRVTESSGQILELRSMAALVDRTLTILELTISKRVNTSEQKYRIYGYQQVESLVFYPVSDEVVGCHRQVEDYGRSRMELQSELECLLCIRTISHLGMETILRTPGYCQVQLDGMTDIVSHLIELNLTHAIIGTLLGSDIGDTRPGGHSLTRH
jgi:hypothetical protein